MISYLMKRTSNLRGFAGVFIIFLLDFLFVFFSYKNNFPILIICIFLYLFIDKVLIQNKKDLISFHIYNGVLKVLEDMLKRDGIIKFYIFIIVLTYVLSLYMIYVNSFIGYICFALIMLLKILVYYLCYGLSKKA
jgi:hypothetical protein